MPTSSVSIEELSVAILKITSKIWGCEGAKENENGEACVCGAMPLEELWSAAEFAQENLGGDPKSAWL